MTILKHHAKNAMKSLLLTRVIFAKNVLSRKKSKMTMDERIKMWVDEELVEYKKELKCLAKEMK